METETPQSPKTKRPKKRNYSPLQIEPEAILQAQLPTFLMVHSTTENQITKLSPFLIAKTFKSMGIEPKSIKSLRSGHLLVQTNSQKESKALLSMTHFANTAVLVEPHRTLNSCKGVINSYDLRTTSEDEILEELSEQGVTAAHRITIRRDGAILPTNTVILTFNTPRLPASIKAGYLHIPVTHYIPNPMRCFSCQLFGHTKHTCKNKPACAKCGSADHTDSYTCENAASCLNCREDHPSFSRECQIWKQEKHIQEIRVKENISYGEAKRRSQQNYVKEGQSYSKAANTLPTIKSFNSVSTQTIVTLRTAIPDIRHNNLKDKIIIPTVYKDDKDNTKVQTKKISRSSSVENRTTSKERGKGDPERRPSSVERRPREPPDFCDRDRIVSGAGGHSLPSLSQNSADMVAKFLKPSSHTKGKKSYNV